MLLEQPPQGAIVAGLNRNFRILERLRREEEAPFMVSARAVHCSHMRCRRMSPISGHILERILGQLALLSASSCCTGDSLSRLLHAEAVRSRSLCELRRARSASAR